MSKEYSRTRRVGEQIQRELAAALRQEIADPRVGMVTVSAVDVSPDFSHAKVYVTTLGDESQREETLAALNAAAGHLRACLARRLAMRTMPQLRFRYDHSVSEGNRLSALIDRAVADDRKNHDEPD